MDYIVKEMFYLRFVGFIIFFSTVECGSYQHVRFFNEKELARKSPRHLILPEIPELPEITLELWNEPVFPLSHTLPAPSKHIDSPAYVIDHGPPRYAQTGQSYQGVYDPFLLTGPAAKRAARYLYSKELFFNEIPHERAMKYNEELRIKNGLSAHRLGSLRWRSPFYRNY
ncbi:uncharacterized protein LOC126266241 [Aethina tumida]|uniref:uncharacterized protein LOC126266241 n=1 Tax=Aethina tumida TaxID=116153 RepID=UPI0021477054|nr:uncharacterized protein LOC126266241 [Aethina tumida]